MRANIQRLLEARVWPGRAIVEVNVDADMDSQTISERTVDPQSQVAVSTDTEESQRTPKATRRGDGGEQPSRRRRQRRRRVEEQRDRRAASGRTTKFPRPSASAWSSRARPEDQRRGHGRRDHPKGADGKEAWAPRPQEEMDTLRQLVQSAIGFDAARGDTVTIESLEFIPTPEQGTAAERPGSQFLDVWGGRLAQLGVLGAIVLALIVFVLRPMMGRRPVISIPELTGPRELGAEPPRRADTACPRHPSICRRNREQDRAAARGHHQSRRGQRGCPPQLDRIPGEPEGARRIMSVYRLETFAPAAGPGSRLRGAPARS